MSIRMPFQRGRGSNDRASPRAVESLREFSSSKSPMRTLAVMSCLCPVAQPLGSPTPWTRVSPGLKGDLVNYRGPVEP